MMRPSLFVALAAASTALVGCFVFAGSTTGYTQEAVTQDGGVAACQADSALCVDYTACSSAVDCAGDDAGDDAGPSICCVGLQVTAPLTVFSSCTRATTCSAGSTFQICTTNEECGSGGACSRRWCTVAPGVEARVQTCGGCPKL